MRWYGLPVLWAVYALLVAVIFWWAVYLGSLGVMVADNTFQFLVHLASPLLAYLVCASALPTVEPGRTLDMRAAYYSGARYFFGISAAYIACTSLVGNLQAGGFEWSTLNAIRLSLFALFVSLLWVRSERFHWFAAIAVLLLLSYRMTIQVLH